VKGSVGRLMESVTEMMGFLDTDVMHDYRQFAELGDVYRESMLSVVSVLEQFSVDTVEMTDKIRTIEENLAQMDIAINESTEEIVQVHSHSMDIKSETVQMVEIAEDNAQKTDEMAEQIKGYTF
jgi:methyl-accepting chemotaxis protein